MILITKWWWWRWLRRSDSGCWPVLGLVLWPVGVAVHAWHGGHGSEWWHGEWRRWHRWHSTGAGQGLREHGAVVEGGVGRVGNGDTLCLDWFSFSCLDVVLFKMHWSVHTMNFVVETTGIAHNCTALLDPSPQCCLTSATVAAAGVWPLLKIAGLPFSLLDQGSVGAIHLVVQATGIAEIITGGITPPKRCVGHPTVDTLSAVVHGWRCACVGWVGRWSW